MNGACQPKVILSSSAILPQNDLGTPCSIKFWRFEGNSRNSSLDEDLETITI